MKSHNTGLGSITMAAVAAVAAVALMPPCAQAQEVRDIADPYGAPIFRLRFFGAGDGPYAGGPGYEQASERDLSAREKNETVAGVAYWAQIIKAVPGQTPAILNVGARSFMNNASAGSGIALSEGPVMLTRVQAALQGQPGAELDHGGHGLIQLGVLALSERPYVPSQLPLGTGWDLQAVVAHEVAHALGISAWVRETGTDGTHAPEFWPLISEYTAHLRDDNGNPARPGQVIYCRGCVNPTDAVSPFDVRDERGYFTGQHVDEVLAGSGLRGVPVRVTDFDEPHNVDDNYMSHLELKNSLMSHQSYRNYTGFMEAELAVLQDLGYEIDRRNFFGRSIYGDGQVIVNDAPYFARNAAGTAYLPGTYNTAMQGLGLHVYGSNNTIYQRADLLTRGAGGAGIRVDGQQNQLTVLPGTRIYADGAYARGVMFAYGRDHTFTQRGDVQALGEHGIAASFDFGNNPLSNALLEYRGSYFREDRGQPAPLLPELNGPLVTQFDLTGRLAGQYAAIYLSDSGYVRQINVMRGASLAGDILSEYAWLDANRQPRLTELTFGKAADVNGNASGAADASFGLQYGGNIVGRNISLQLVGGTTLLSGDHVVHDVGVAPGATLMGDANYTVVGLPGATAAVAPAGVRYALNTPGQFTNSGTVVPLLGSRGNSLTINGDYVQTPTGTLQIDLNPAKSFTRLVVNGHATLDGTLAIAPQRGWYASGFNVRVDHLVSATNIDGTFASVTPMIPSPTLGMGVVPQAGGTYAVTVARAANAYSRYGADRNAQQVGSALDRIAGTASPALQPLVVALDFSATDGREVRSALRQLSPTVYGAMFTGALLRERQITELVATAAGAQASAGRDRAPDSTPDRAPERGRASDANAARPRSDWRAFAMPFGAGYWRGAAGDMPGANGNTYGVVFGAERELRTAGETRDWTLGVHGALSGQSTRLDGGAGSAGGSGRTTALDAGVHARYRDAALSGPHAFAALRAGVEDGRADRAMAVNGYTGSARGTWTGTAAAATLGGGWRWALTPTTAVGPIAALDYAWLHRPGVSETGGAGAGAGDSGMRLALDSQTFQSLRSRLGAELRFELPAAAGHVLRASLQASWNHELLGGAVTQGAVFASDPSARFTTRTAVVGRDSLGVQAGLSYRVGQRMTFGAALAGNLYRAGDADLAGSVSATWRF